MGLHPGHDRATGLVARGANALDAADVRAILPRFIRYRDAPAYLGMDKWRFEREVRSHPDMIEIPIGKRGIAFDRYDLDAWKSDEPWRRRQRAREARQAHLRDRAGIHREHRRRAFERWEHVAKLPRHMLITLATPAWADRRAIARVYAIAAGLTRTTGILHHVDHIIPLQGELVTGLHVAENLKPIPAVDNLRKSNRFTP